MDRPFTDDRAAEARSLLREIWDQVGRDRLMLTSAGVAFFAFLAVIPAMAAMVSIAGLVLSPETVAARTRDLFANLPAEARNLLTSELERVSGRAAGSLSVGAITSLLLSLWSASSGMGHLMEGLNVAYDERDSRSMVRKRGLALAFTLGAVVFVVAAIVGLTALPAILTALGLPAWARGLLTAAFWLMLPLAFIAGLAVLYRFGPDRVDTARRPWISWGAATAVVLWILASLGFRFYAATVGSYDASYGSLAAVAVLLTWLLITALVVLLGAEVNAVLQRRRDRAGPPREDPSSLSSRAAGAS